MTPSDGDAAILMAGRLRESSQTALDQVHPRNDARLWRRAMARTSTGQIRSKAVILVALAAVLLVAVAVVIGRSPPTPPSIDEAAAERIATDLVVRWEASDSDAHVIDVVVERYEDHDTVWRVTVRADLLVGLDKTAIAYYYQIDVDKQTATPSLYNQG